jgi:hypothetical protein
MKREEIADLMAFVVVAEERSFTRAAARLKPWRCASLYTAFNLPGWSHSTIHWLVLKIPDTAN